MDHGICQKQVLRICIPQNEVFYITFILGIIIVLCITAGYWEVDRRQEKIYPHPIGISGKTAAVQ